MDKELKALIDRIGLGPDAILTRLRFLEWQASDGARLKGAAADLDDAHVRFIDRIYGNLGTFEKPMALLDDPQRLARLKRSQRGYYKRLWTGPYDRSYVIDRLKVGLVHERVGLDLEWYLGAYRLYLGDMLAELLGDAPGYAVYDSLLKAVFFDMILAIDTYTAAQRQALEESDRNTFT
jgi:hypothetical protein